MIKKFLGGTILTGALILTSGNIAFAADNDIEKQIEKLQQEIKSLQKQVAAQKKRTSGKSGKN